MRALLLLCLIGCAAQPQVTARPRLGVIVIFDQLRATDVDRYGAFFAGGFGGLMARGAARYDAQYTYANTETAPGHATISTGANPSLHGIVSNYWFSAGKPVYAVEDPESPMLGNPNKRGASARHLMAVTLGDAMKIESNGSARVVSISMKDRAAILSVGKTADLAVWFDRDTGAFTTSAAYAKALPPWLSTLAQELPAKSMAQGRWSPLPVPELLTPLVPEDAHPNEGGESGWTDRFPHDLATLPEQKKRNSYLASPQGMADLFTLAGAAIDGEQLGQDAVTDLLVLSVSCTDYVSHGFGPTSREHLDMLRRADLELRQLIARLDSRLGADGYVLAVASDHASTPLPERVRALRFPAGRIVVDEMLAKADQAIDTAVGKNGSPPAADPKSRLKWIRGFAAPHVYMAIDHLRPDVRDSALSAARSAFLATHGIAATYTPSGTTIGGDLWASSFEQLMYPGRIGQLMLRHEPRYLYQYDVASGTDHGSPYAYDNRIAFFVTGPGVRRGRYAELRDVRDIAPTLAFLLHAPRPDFAQGKAVPAVGD